MKTFLNTFYLLIFEFLSLVCWPIL